MSANRKLRTSDYVYSQPANTAFAVGKSATSDGTITNYVSAADPASMRITDTDTYIIGGWVKPTLTSHNEWAIAKGSGAAFSYGFNVQATTGKVLLLSRKSTVATQNLTSDDAISDGVAAFVLCWMDGTNQNVNINNGTTKSAAISLTTFTDPGGNVSLFALPGVANSGLVGVLDEVFFCKNPSNMTTAISTILDQIYNSGTGRRLCTVNATVRNTIGLVSWWGLDEADAATRKDLYGANDLSLTGTITQSTAIVS